MYFDDAKQLWRGEVSAGYSAEGKRQRRRVYAKTKRELQEKLAGLQHEVRRGVVVTPERISIDVLLQRWLDDCVAGQARPSTEKRYRSIVRNHILPHIGRTLVSQVSPLTLQSLYSDLRKAEASPRTRELVHQLLHKALGQAVKWSLIQTNPARDVERPRVPRKAMQVWTADEVKRFLDVAKDDRLFAMYALALTHGLRQGELFALRWQDIDLRACVLNVQHNLQEDGTQLVLAEPKTQRGRRRIELSQTAVAALKDHRLQMLKEGRASPDAPVFCDTDGGFLRRPNVLRRSFKPLIAAADVRNIRFHDMRHTAATLLLGAKIPAKVVSEMLGHASITITLDTYSHVLPSMQQEAAAAIDRLLLQ